MSGYNVCSIKASRSPGLTCSLMMRSRLRNVSLPAWVRGLPARIPVRAGSPRTQVLAARY
jgi:hypothetical protein